MKYKQKKNKLHIFSIDSDNIQKRTISEYHIQEYLKKRLEKTTFNLHKKVYQFETDYVTFTINTVEKRLYHNWIVQLMYLPKKLLPFIKHSIEYERFNHTNISNVPIVNKILRIDEENVIATVKGENYMTTICKVVLLVGASFRYTGDTVPQLDGKLLIRIYNPELFT